MCLGVLVYLGVHASFALSAPVFKLDFSTAVSLLEIIMTDDVAIVIMLMGMFLNR